MRYTFQGDCRPETLARKSDPHHLTSERISEPPNLVKRGTRYLASTSHDVNVLCCLGPFQVFLYSLVCACAEKDVMTSVERCIIYKAQKLSLSMRVQMQIRAPGAKLRSGPLEMACQWRRDPDTPPRDPPLHKCT